MLRQLARRPRLAIVFVMATALVGRALLLPIIGIPNPSVHDEFSYLLAGETFAEGRVTNPPHPMWTHFESVHILQQPTYMSMYQPAQGLVLALGVKAAHRAWFGIWLSVVVLSGALCWMLQAWLSPVWALVGGLLFVVRWGLYSYWVNGLWGGAVPALGGALVIGSLPRLLRFSRIRDAVCLTAGLVLLAASRPFEGLVVSAAAMVCFFCWAARRRLLHRVVRARILVTGGLVLALGACAMLYYNQRVTGSALKLPYVADREEYGIAPLFLWQSLKPEPAYRSASLRKVYEEEVVLYKKGRAYGGVLEGLRKCKDFWLFYVGPLLTLPLLALLRGGVAGEQRTKFFLLVMAVLLMALLGEVWFYAHYAAPAMCVNIALLLQGLRKLRHYCWRGKAVGLVLVRAVPVACVLLGIIPLSAALARIPLQFWPMQWYAGKLAVIQPARLTLPFTSQHEKILIIVKYGPTHDVGDEWVYNEADLDKADVIWARNIDGASDARLVHYFDNRRAFIFEPDKHPWMLQPYFDPLAKHPSNAMHAPR